MFHIGAAGIGMIVECLVLPGRLEGILEAVLSFFFHVLVREDVRPGTSPVFVQLGLLPLPPQSRNILGRYQTADQRQEESSEEDSLIERAAGLFRSRPFRMKRYCRRLRKCTTKAAYGATQLSGLRKCQISPFTTTSIFDSIETGELLRKNKLS